MLLRSDIESRSDMELEDDDELVILALAARAASKRMAPICEASWVTYCSCCIGILMCDSSRTPMTIEPVP